MRKVKRVQVAVIRRDDLFVVFLLSLGEFKLDHL